MTQSNYKLRRKHIKQMRKFWRKNVGAKLGGEQ